jgi:hypothetical protein
MEREVAADAAKRTGRQAAGAARSHEREMRAMHCLFCCQIEVAESRWDRVVKAVQSGMIS